MQKFFIPTHIKNTPGCQIALETNQNIARDSGFEHQVFFPDIGPNIGLPNGSTTVMPVERFLSPSFIGHDIGCGYLLASVPVRSASFIKKKGVDLKKVQRLVNRLSEAISGTQHASLIGKGNHFVDIMLVDEVYDSTLSEMAATLFIFIHTGSGQKGFEIFSAFQEERKSAVDPVRFNRTFMEAFSEARSHAMQRRQQLLEIVCEELAQKYGSDMSADILLNVPHNEITELEAHYRIQKGTQVFSNGFAVIAGSSTDFSYLVRPGPNSEEAWDTINHGAGRRFDKTKARHRFKPSDVEGMFRDVALNVPFNKFIEQAPMAYRDISEIIDYLETEGLVRKACRLKPIGVIVEGD